MDYPTRYHPSRDQVAIAEELASSFDELLPLSRLHISLEESDDTWRALHELGIFGITLGEDVGGSGLGATEEALIVMGLGRRLVAPAVVASIGAIQALVRQGMTFDPVRCRIASGYRRDERILKIADRHADIILLRHSNESALVASSASQRLDDRLWLADLHAVTAMGKTIATFHVDQLLRLRLLDAALLTGVAETAVAMSVAYAGMREQFGRPIGSFQAVKHHCANMAMAARRARDQACFAAVAMDECRKDAQLQVECAFLTAGAAALETAALNIQIHGGMGFSDEADPHLLLKRAQLYINIGGGLESASARVAAIEPAL